MKAYGYLRVSSLGQLDGSGFERQKEEIIKFCEKEGITLVDFYEEKGVSGTLGEEERPAFQDMITAILSNGVRAVVVERLDRLAREYMIQESMLIYLAAKGITLFCAATGENITEAIKSDPMKKAIIRIQGTFAELEKDLIVQKLAKARILKKANCGKCEGRKGWNDFPELKAQITERIKSLRRKPRRGKVKTFKEVAEVLNKEGILNFSGEAWTANAVIGFARNYV